MTTPSILSHQAQPELSPRGLTKFHLPLEDGFTTKSSGLHLGSLSADYTGMLPSFLIGKDILDEHLKIDLQALGAKTMVSDYTVKGRIYIKHSLHGGNPPGELRSSVVDDDSASPD